MSKKEEFTEQMEQDHKKSAEPPDEHENEMFEIAKAIMELEPNANPSFNEWSFNDFEISKCLGCGAYGKIFLAREKKTNYLLALKTIVKKEIQESHMEQAVTREIRIQSRLKHPNICELLHCFEDDLRIYLALEYASKGDLFDALKNSPRGRFGEHCSAKYSYQVADAVNYCHQNKVMHRDIKLENILLTITGDVKLADFGLSIQTSHRTNTMVGTLEYLAPEIVEGVEYDERVDHWSLGVLCYEFLVGCTPFQGASEDETLDKILKLAVVYPRHLKRGAKDLIKRLLVLTPDKRMSLPDVMGHPWILKNK